MKILPQFRENFYTRDEEWPDILDSEMSHIPAIRVLVEFLDHESQNPHEFNFHGNAIYEKINHRFKRIMKNGDENILLKLICKILNVSFLAKSLFSNRSNFFVSKSAKYSPRK